MRKCVFEGFCVKRCWDLSGFLVPLSCISFVAPGSVRVITCTAIFVSTLHGGTRSATNTGCSQRIIASHLTILRCIFLALLLSAVFWGGVSMSTWRVVFRSSSMMCSLLCYNCVGATNPVVVVWFFDCVCRCGTPVADARRCSIVRCTLATHDDIEVFLYDTGTIFRQERALQ